MQIVTTLHHLFLDIQITYNRYLLLAWLMFYPTLFVVVWQLPLGYYQIIALIAVLLFAVYALFSRVLLRWPEHPRQLTLQVDGYGRVSITIDNQPQTNWFFSFRHPRLVVLVICYDRFWFWLPRFTLWFSPHNTDEETHRHLRIVARFGALIPMQIIENEEELRKSLHVDAKETSDISNVSDINDVSDATAKNQP